MLDSILSVNSFCWAGGWNLSPAADEGLTCARADAQELRGQFSFASEGPDGTVTLVRDGLGLNKLFFAIHESGTVQAANYLVDLTRRHVPFEAIYSVPAGHFVEIDPERKTLSSFRHFALEDPSPGQEADPVSVAQTIRKRLELSLSRLSEQFKNRRVCVALSGGIDSGMIAAVARQYFPDITAYTYGFVDSSGTTSEDVDYAERLAHFLGIRFRFVPATAEDVMGALENALCYGQDWRDFNVHCAIVNEIVARAIRSDAGATESDPPIVLTGDLANEFMADYTPVSYDGQEYYRLPKVSPAELRLALIRGLDVGDREIGVFNHHGVEAIQPYGLLLDAYLGLPASFLCQDRCKQTLAREIAGDLLPDFIFDRAKVRAQIGNSTQPTGILPILVEKGRDSGWLRQAFCRLLGIEDQKILSRLVRAGRYRFMTMFPTEGRRINGYLVA